MLKEIREFFKCDVNVEATSVHPENVEIQFNKIVLYREDDDSCIEISDRKTVVEKIRTSNGLTIRLFILNESENVEERIDYLLDEDYEIEFIDLSIKHILKNTNYDYTINDNNAEQVKKEVDVELSEDLNKVLKYVTPSSNKKIAQVIYPVIKDDTDFINTINSIINIEVV